MAGLRDEELLDHIGLYWITTRPVLCRLFFPGGNPGHVLHRLRRARLITERPLGGASHYYQLTGAGARSRVPAKRAAALSESVVEKHLAVLHFSCLAGTPRRRLEHAELTAFFGRDVPLSPQIAHCLDDVAGARRIHRLYVPSRRVNAGVLVRRITADIDDVLASPGKLADYAAAGSYSFTVLVDSEARAAVLNKAMQRSGVRESARVEVRAVPSR